MKSWSPDTWIQFGLLIVAALTSLGTATWALIKLIKWLRDNRPRLKVEMKSHAFLHPTTGRAIGNGIKVRIVHRGGRPVKIQHVFCRVKGVDLTKYFSAGWTGGIGANPIQNMPKNETWLEVRFYRMINKMLVVETKDEPVEFAARHEESYYVAIPIQPDEINQYFLKSGSEDIELVAKGPDDEIVLKRGFEVQSLIEGLTTHYPGLPINFDFPYRFGAHTISKTPPNISKVGTYNDRGVTIPPPLPSPKDQLPRSWPR